MILRFITLLRLIVHVILAIALLTFTGALWNSKNQWVKRFKQWWLKRIIQLIKVDVKTQGVLPSSSGPGVLYVSNHVSWVDIPLLGGLFQFNFLSKAEVQNWPLFGKIAEATGTLFIKRGAGEARNVSKRMADYLDNGRSVLFFPEGTTSDGSQVKRFHARLFRVCEFTQVNVCPLVIDYKITGKNKTPVPYIDDDEIGTHLWNLLLYRNIQATVRFLPVRPLSTDSLDRTVRNLRQEVEDSLMDIRAKEACKESPSNP